MTENQEHKWNDMSLKSLEGELRCLPEVKVPERLKTKLLAAIQSRQQKISIGHRLEWHLGARDLVATAVAAIFIFASMLMVSYGLPNPPQTLLTELNDSSLRYKNIFYDQNYVLVKDNNYTSCDAIK
jgi:dihydroorotase